MVETSKIRPLLLTKEIPVNGYDIDVVGIVSNIVYIRWFEDLRMLFLDTHYPFRELLQENTSPVLKETHIDYKYPVTIQDRIQGHIWMSEVTKSKWKCSFEILGENRIHAVGSQVGYFINVERKRPVRIPEKFRKLWEKAIEKGV